MTKQDGKLFKSFDSYNISLGEILRGERATLGKTYEQVHKDLKIKKEFIQAIENCDLGGVENKSFIAGYVRTYARYLELDPENVYERFCQESGFLSAEVNPFHSSNKKKIKRKTVDIQFQNYNWEPGKLVKGQNVSQNFIINLFYKAAPLLSLLLVLFGVGYWAKNIIIDIQRLEIVAIEQEPYNSADLLNEINILGTDSNLDENNLDLVLNNNHLKDDNFLRNYYASREEFFPIVENRDSPIVRIDPNTYGIFIKQNDEISFKELEENLNASSPAYAYYEHKPLVVISPKTPLLKIIALEKSWLRLRDQQGDIYIERNFNAGEEFVVPNNLFSGSLRAGNATKVYFDLDGEVLGPLSTGKSVVKNFSLDPLQIRKELVVIKEDDEIFRSYQDRKSQGLSTANRVNE